MTEGAVAGRALRNVTSAAAGRPDREIVIGDHGVLVRRLVVR
ncbi:hypothetical protein AB0H60_21025 [Nocardia rhamnosiphila]